MALLAAKLGLQYVLTIGRLTILARLLSPSDFGVFGLALVLLSGLETATSLGPEKYLVQRKEIDDRFVGTVWTVRFCLGLLVCLLALLAAPFYAMAVGEPEVHPVLSIVCFAYLFQSARSTGAFLAERRLEFGRVAAYELSMVAIESGLLVGLALTVGGATALAWALLANSTLSSAFSYVVFGFGARPCWERAAAWELLGVGRHFLVIAVGSFVMVYGDNLIVGRLLGATSLGFYVVAYKLCDLPLQITFQVTNRVALPAFSRVQHEPERRRRGFLIMADLQAACLIPIVCAVVLLAHLLVRVLYGDSWAPAVPVVRALGLVMLGRGISHIIIPYIVANGHFSFSARVKWLETGVFLGSVVAGTHWHGLAGGAIGAGLGYMTAAVARVIFVSNTESISLREWARLLGAPLVASTPGLGVVCILEVSLAGAAPSLRLAVACAAYCTSYAVVTYAFRPKLREAVRKALAGLRGGQSLW